MRRAAILVGLTLLTGCGIQAQDPFYPVDKAAALSRLTNADAPIGILGSEAVDWRTSHPADDTVAWTVVDRNDRAMLRFTARVTPAEGGVRVASDVIPVSGRHEAAVRRGLAQHPEIAALYRAAIREQVAATLENRTFDFSHIAAETTVATMANIRQFAASPGVSR